MKKLISFTLALIMMLGVVSFSVFADGASGYTMQFSVRGVGGTAEVYIDDVYAGEAPYTAKIAKGTKVTLISDDDGFVCFADSNMNTLTEEKTYTFTFSGESVVYCFAKSDDKTTVIYRNTNSTKQILAYSTYSDAIAMENHFVKSATLFGKTFVAWDKTVDQIITLANNGTKTIFVNPTYTTTTETCVVSATNGTVNGGSSATVIVGSQITLVSDTPELDKKFAYWTNANGDIISDKPSFTMYAVYGENYRAVFVDEDEVLNVVPSASLKCNYLDDIDRIEIFTQRFIPEGATVTANGLLYLKDGELDEADMILDNVDGTNLFRLNQSLAVYSGFVRNTTSCEEFICLRPFITYEMGGQTNTVYGSRVIAKKNQGQTVWVDEDFESITSITPSSLTGNNKMSASSASGFSIATSGENSVASSASSGGYIIFDDTGLDLAKAESVTVSADIMLTAYPSDSISLITLITSGSGYNFFLKVNSSGELIGSDWGKIKDNNNNNLTFELNRSYNVKAVYNVATRIYDLYLDQTLISSKAFSTDIKEATSLSVRFFEYNKGAVGTLDNIKIISSYEEAKRVALNTLSSWGSAYFTVTTDKNPISYSTNEEMTFTFDLRNGTGGATCEQIKLEVKSDDDPTVNTVMLDGGTGVTTYTTSLEEAGFVYIKATACDASGAAYSGSEVAKVGAGADVTSITASETRPSDFDEFWSANVEDLMAINPEIIEMELIAQTSDYKAYNVKIKAVDDTSLYSDGEAHDYVSGVLTVPTKAKDLKIRLVFGGYGIYGANVDYNAGEIVFVSLAHSIDAYESSSYYTAYSNGDLKNYGGLYTSGANTDRDAVYFKNMVLRDLQALRFVTDHFGPDGEALWDGENVIVEGGSQGGFRGSAVASLADQVGVTVTKAELQMVWLCDINAEENGRIYSKFWPEFTYSAMQYYDSVFFGENIECDVEMRTGLGDDVAPPRGIAALYNAIASNNKRITFVQNREHGSSGTSSASFTINPHEGGITVYVDEKLSDSIPAKGNYVVYVKGGREDEWQSWDYDSWSIVDYDKYDEYVVCFVSVDKLYDSFEALCEDSAALTVGTLVGTRSYYADAGKGAAAYVVCATSTSGEISVGSGKYVALEPFACGDKMIITPEQLGAYGEGESSDHAAINKAFAYTAANTVEFESKVYLQTNKINLERGNVTINGNGAVICNRYDWAYEELGEGETYDPEADTTVVNSDFRIYGSPTEYLENVTICNLEIRCTEIRGQSILYRAAGHSQLESNYTDGLVIRDCRIINPYYEDAPTERHVTSVSITNSNGTVFENNTVINLSHSPSNSGGVWFSANANDFTKVSTNITVRNNYIEKTGHDETLAFFLGAFDGITVENNTIYTHDEPEGYASAHIVGFGVWDCPTTVKNATFTGNKIDAVTSRDIVMFSCVENIEIYDNEIVAYNNTASEPIMYGVFRVTYIEENYTSAGVTVTQTNVKIYDNKITVYNTNEIPLSYDCGDGFTFTNNEYVCNVK